MAGLLAIPETKVEETLTTVLGPSNPLRKGEQPKSVHVTRDLADILDEKRQELIAPKLPASLSAAPTPATPSATVTVAATPPGAEDAGTAEPKKSRRRKAPAADLPTPIPDQAPTELPPAVGAVALL
jgi:hypothetical protein